jgi:hypothetical protein
MVDDLSSLSIFGQKLPDSERHEQGHCHDARSKHQAKDQFFSDEQPHVTLPIFPINNAGSLFDFVQETQVNNLHLPGEFSDVQFFRRLSRLPDPL